LTSLQAADLIYVLEGGRVVEHGTPSALLARGGAYARLVGHQAISVA
jgi:ABC-type multidrug transport system fused ATPase/permease subunit